jgi:hypothetical protein
MTLFANDKNLLNDTGRGTFGVFLAYAIQTAILQDSGSSGQP